MIDHPKSTGQDLLEDVKVFGSSSEVSSGAFQPCRVPVAMGIQRAKLAIPRLSDSQKLTKTGYNYCSGPFLINQRGIIYRKDSRLKVETVTIYV